MVSLLSPFLTPTTNGNAVLTHECGSKRAACTCRCHFCQHSHHSQKFVSSVSENETGFNEDYTHCILEERAEDILAADEMKCCRSQIISPLRLRGTMVSQGSSSLRHFGENSNEFKSRDSSKLISTTTINNGTNGKPCCSEEFTQTCPIPSSSTCNNYVKNGCKRCKESVSDDDDDGSVTFRSYKNRERHLQESENGDNKHFLKTWINCSCSTCHSDDNASKINFVESTPYLTNEPAKEYRNTNEWVEPENQSESRAIMEGQNRKSKITERKGFRTTLLIRADQRLWLLCASLMFLSLLGPTCSYSVFDDDDDDYGVGMSHYSVYSRHRRSAEDFSSLHDALSLIPSNYSIHEPPPTNNSEATQVDFSVLIMNVRDIKELNEGYGDLELSLEMNLRIYWKDTRLSHLADRSGNKFIVLNPILLDKLWHPDIFIDHVKGVAQPALISKPASLRVYPDSSVRYSARITVTMACQMDFHYYPADTQRCSVDMKSYAYSNRILALDWREGKGALLVEYLELPNFDVALDTTQNFMVNTSSGSYSGIRFTILLRRKLSYHLIQTYLPSTLFIIVSWLSFLVPPESVPGRMALCMTTLLTLTAMFSAVRQNTPNVSYVKALDIWMVVCIIFVFLTLVEYTVLLKLKSKKTKPKPPVSAHPAEHVIAAAQTQQQPPPATRWTIPSLQYTTDSAKFRGCKNTDGVISENGNGTNGEMRHRENGENGAASGDNVNINTMNIPPVPPNSAHPPRSPSPPPPPPQILGPGERPLNKYELAAKKIEKFTSAVIPTLFVIFQFIYWPWLINSSEYYNQDKSTTIFKSM